MHAFNHDVASNLREIAALLNTQHANPFRCNAYLHAADTLDNMPQNIAELMQAEGIQGLIALPGIGEGIARSIYEYIATGRMSRLENLKGAADPVALFRSIPTVGRDLAERIHDSLHVESLEALENAVRGGQLARVEGLGGLPERAAHGGGAHRPAPPHRRGVGDSQGRICSLGLYAGSGCLAGGV